MQKVFSRITLTYAKSPRKKVLSMDVEELKENTEEAIDKIFVKDKRSLDPVKIAFIAGILFAIFVVGTTIMRALNYSALKKENQNLLASVSEMEDKVTVLEETQAKLADSEQQVQLLKESTNALKEQVSDLNAEKEDLNNQLEDLLHVQETVPEITRELLDEEITSLSELVTKKYWYRNATRKEEAKEWLWGTSMPFSDIEFLAMYDGYITAGIDLKEVKFDVDEQNRTITVNMPKSKIFDHNIPQETINVLQVKNNLFNSVSFNDYNRFISGEKKEMEDTAIGKGILKEADDEARDVLDAFLKTIPGISRYKI